MAADTRDSASAGRAQRLALRTAREPLVQFVAIALVMFGANQLINVNELQRSGEGGSCEVGVTDCGFDDAQGGVQDRIGPSEPDRSASK